MTDDAAKLAAAARQIVETDLLMGGTFMPRRRKKAAAATTQAATAPAAAKGSLRTAAPPPHVTPGAEGKAAALAAIDEAEVRACTKCCLSKGRTQTVFGEGDPGARLVFVGEGPGEEEDRTGRPFVGRAGELLTNMITAMGLSRAEVYICNVVKCRPPHNRTPSPDEAQACWSYLVRQLQIISPEVIVTLGNPATQALLDTKVGITRLRGQWQTLPAIAEGLEGIAVMPTFHPSYVLRQYNAQTRGMVWSDLQQVMAKLGLKRS
ncbi:MAG: uracil-DNA glycosylase [Phycisphaerae bacterium]|jgi:DNA polymerase